MRMLSYQQYYNMRPDEFKPDDVIQVNAVLVLGYGGDMALYVAPDETWDAERIAREGDKVMLTRGEQAAKALFPTAADGCYYRR